MPLIFAQTSPSISAQILIATIPIVGIVMGAIVVFFYLLWNHKQKMLIIEKGLWKKTPFDLKAFSLLSGLVLFCIGTVLTLFFYLKEGIAYGLLSGLIPLALGISLIIYFVSCLKLFRNNNESDNG